MADRVSLALGQLNRIKSQALENQRLTQSVEKVRLELGFF